MKQTTSRLKKEIKKAKSYYSEQAFWSKLKRYAQKAGSSLVYTALLLYYTLLKPEVPGQVKAMIIGSLGYFIMPLDLIPDVLTGVGYTDDLGAFGFALVQVAMYIDDDVKMKAKHKLQQWFGENVETSTIDKKIN